MINIFTKVLLIIYGISNAVALVDIYCKFMNINFGSIIFSCDVSNNLNISTPNDKVGAIHGFLSRGKYFSDIKGLSIVNKQTEYLPINLGQQFTELLALRVKDGKLNKIDHDDLKSIPKVRYVDFDSNGLEIIEKDLFKFNPQLEYISFDANRIKSVGVNVFDNLQRLNILDMSSTSCIQIKANNRIKIQNALPKIKERCSSFSDEVIYYKWKIEMFVNRNSILRNECNNIDAEIVVGDEKLKHLEESIKNLENQEVENEQNFINKLEYTRKVQIQSKVEISILEREIINKTSDNKNLEEIINIMHQNISELQQNIKIQIEKVKQDEQKTEGLKEQNKQMLVQLENLEQNKTLLNKEHMILNMEYTAMMSSDVSPRNLSLNRESLIFIVPLFTLIVFILDYFTTLNFLHRFSIFRIRRFFLEK